MKKILFILLPFLSNAQVKHSMQMDMPKNIIIQKTTPYNTPLKSLVSTVNSYKGKKVEYDLYVNDTIVNYTGKNRKAIAINGSIPAPTLEFTEGDTAIIHVHNRMHMETSIHWHGLLLPNKEDGVPYLTTSPVEAGETYTFTFPIIQSGTYWYHSHTMLQEQNGLYGSIVIHSAKPEPKLKEYVMLLSDWTDEKPEQALRYLKRGGEWYAIKKGALQSYGEAIAAGYFKDKVKQEWQRMTPMDVSDVYYNKFLMNGKEKSEFKDAKPGEIIRLRIINGSASTYFNLQYGNSYMRIIAADGVNVSPVSVNKLEIAIAETYDVLITVPENGKAELRATSWDITGYSSGYFGTGAVISAPEIPKLNYFKMMREMGDMNMNGMNMNSMKGMKMNGMKGMEMKGDSNSNKMDMNKMDGMNMKGDSNSNKMNMNKMDGMDMGQMDMPSEFNYDMLRSITPTTLDSNLIPREVKLKLTGNMLRYIWSFDDKTLSNSDKILIRKGEKVRFVLQNTTMMRHPMHLHGHYFRFINAQGEYAPLKHTFDIKPMETITIEFEANEEKDWFFHCHILYHMMSGMARIVSYEGIEQNQFAKTNYKKLKKEDNALYPWYDLSVHSQGAWLSGNVSNNKNALEFEGRVSWDGNFETETHLLRYIDKRQFLAFYIGYDTRANKTLPLYNESNTKDNRNVFDAGVYYLLPMLVRSEWRIDHTGKVRLQLERRDLPLSNNFFFDWRVNTDKEYTVGFRYMVAKPISISTNYDSDYKWGVGLTWHY
ncbi:MULTISPECIES: multicopper oxidase domain-containing protein [unclassified Arcicella]|uniref:multicopper oxidase domain-containing protein n=1 Tax=unclassified Arcicella TaxID=2644986 RepID=UPI0028675DA5|nr:MULTISPECIES: multicopper oxidase domain-containing protein [unclassified Arcicella]MDR6563729.1 CopA family copper-resistance protein [Arcicella sp. BE51]MDR6813587.1 CopA family copper-resistance protein [Arcicella sp. BE140]MDR6824899.1 CopA family copper-resistance protein [Arcicella sp. BE139]